jgi:hypothetical protein
MEGTPRPVCADQAFETGEQQRSTRPSSFSVHPVLHALLTQGCGFVNSRRRVSCPSETLGPQATPRNPKPSVVPLVQRLLCPATKITAGGSCRLQCLEVFPQALKS